MKYLISFFLVGLPFMSLYSQGFKGTIDLPRNDKGLIEYSSVIQMDTCSAEILYSRAKLFIANYFNSAPDVTKLEDASSHTLVVKALFPRIYTNPFNKAHGGNVKFQFTIQCKNGRYKYAINNLVHSDINANGNFSGGDLENEKPLCGTFFMTRKIWYKIKAESDQYANQMISNLKTTMAGSENFTSDNW